MDNYIMYLELPIMPLNAVLFPGMPMPLFVFEPRYRAMISECVEEEVNFGVALVREGTDFGEGGLPWEIGTVAKIVRSLELAEGGLHVLTIGTQRYRLQALLRHEPYLVGVVELLAEEFDEPAPDELHQELRELFLTHLRLVLQLVGQPEAEVTVPETACRLSYMVAAHLTCPPLARQRLLEMDSVAQRLFSEKHLLLQESEEYRLLLAARRKYDSSGGRIEDGVFSLN